jgi:DNA polymerase-4
MFQVLEALLTHTDIGKRKVRLLGISLSTLENQFSSQRIQQMDLFRDC